MQNYLNLLQEVLDTGIRQSNRTGTDTLTVPGTMLKFDVSKSFPAVTTKRLAFGQVKSELIGFLKGVTNAAEFRALGCNVWTQNANENKDWLANPNRKGEDDLGRIYGQQWRGWTTTKYDEVEGGHEFTFIDQIAVALDTVRNNPESRRILVSAWRPDQFDYMALPPCHFAFQLLPHIETKVIHMTMSMRSADLFLGVSFNIAFYAILLSLFAKWTGYTAGTLTMFMSDTHIYLDHIDQVKLQLTREPKELPKLSLRVSKDCETMTLEELLNDLNPEDITLVNYVSDQTIRAPMAV